MQRRGETLQEPLLTPDALFDLYCAYAPPRWPRPRTVNATRLAKLRAYAVAFPVEAWWHEVFVELNASAFLTSSQFRNAGLDWLLSKHKTYGVENCLRVHDGVYRESWTPLPKRTEANARALASFVERG